MTPTTLVPDGAAALASSIIARPPAAWTVRIAGCERVERLHRLGDGVGDVVELEVEEDRQAERGHLADAVGAVGREEFEAELDPADMGPDLGGNGFGAVEIGRVDRDVDRAASFGRPGLGCRSPARSGRVGRRRGRAGAGAGRLTTWACACVSSRRCSDQSRAR